MAALVFSELSDKSLSYTGCLLAPAPSAMRYALCALRFALCEWLTADV